MDISSLLVWGIFVAAAVCLILLLIGWIQSQLATNSDSIRKARRLSVIGVILLYAAILMMIILLVITVRQDLSKLQNQQLTSAGVNFQTPEPPCDPEVDPDCLQRWQLSWQDMLTLVAIAIFFGFVFGVWDPWRKLRGFRD